MNGFSEFLIALALMLIACGFAGICAYALLHMPTPALHDLSE